MSASWSTRGQGTRENPFTFNNTAQSNPSPTESNSGGSWRRRRPGMHCGTDEIVPFSVSEADDDDESNLFRRQSCTARTSSSSPSERADARRVSRDRGSGDDSIIVRSFHHDLYPIIAPITRGEIDFSPEYIN